MKLKTNFEKGSRMTQSPYTRTVKSLIIIAFISAGIQLTLQAQDASPVKAAQYTKPTWWVGIAAGGNFNFYRGTTQELNSNLTVPTAFNRGGNLGLYLAPLVEFHRPDSRLGVMLQAGYDGRNGEFENVRTPCNCRSDLSTNLAYITVEPSLRFAPFKSNFYLFGGPRFAFNVAKSFTYKQTSSLDFPPQEPNPVIKGDLSKVYPAIVSMQIGAGYDIPLSSENKQRQTVLSPFVSFQPYFGQSPRSIETWTVTTLRIGAALKFGRGKLISSTAAIVPVAAVDPLTSFTVTSPKNLPVERRVRETFPLRNYIFFNKGSTEIPDRYVLITKDQVKDFKEDQLEVFTPKKLSGRSSREMIVYYNVLNILGDRMGKEPSSTITLVGSSEKGPEDGKAMAESVRNYLTSVFGIAASRISIEGRNKPKIPSEKPGATQELDLLREGDRRVSIESNAPSLLMEFQSGPGAPLKPVDITAVQEAPLDSYVTFNTAGSKKAFTSWSVETRNENGEVQYFGPYTRENVSVPGKSILGTRPEGDYKVTMIGKTKSGKTVKQETSVHMVLWTPPKDEEGMRFSVLFEFNESKAISMYKKYLTEIVTPKIPKDGTVIIHGHTDIIGEEVHNQKLSLARANEVQKIIEKALSKAGRSDVTFVVHGFGEDQNAAPFENNFPEERFYNRTVVIDIIPHK